MVTHWYQVVGNFGLDLYAYIMLIFFLWIFSFVEVQWRCGLCGKMNVTGLLKALLCMCDHAGLR